MQNLLWKGMRLRIIREVWKQRNKVTFRQWKVGLEEILGNGLG